MGTDRKPPVSPLITRQRARWGCSLSPRPPRPASCLSGLSSQRNLTSAGRTSRRYLGWRWGRAFGTGEGAGLALPCGLLPPRSAPWPRSRSLQVPPHGPCGQGWLLQARRRFLVFLPGARAAPPLAGLGAEPTRVRSEVGKPCPPGWQLPLYRPPGGPGQRSCPAPWGTGLSSQWGYLDQHRGLSTCPGRRLWLGPSGRQREGQVRGWWTSSVSTLVNAPPRPAGWPGQ